TFQLKDGPNNVGTAVTSNTLVNGATGNVTYIVPAGTAAGMYTLSATYNPTSNFSGSVDTSKNLTINPASLTVTANNATRLYGAIEPTFTGVISGVQAGDG